MNKPTLSRTNTICGGEYENQLSKPVLKRTITVFNNRVPADEESDFILNNAPYLQQIAVLTEEDKILSFTYNFYLCTLCDNATSNDDPDCSHCKRIGTMKLYQTASLQDAMLQRNNERDINYDEDRFVECDECNNQVDCYKHSIHIAYKGEAGNPTEELTMCTMCFQDMEEELIENNYLCDDWEDEDENEEEKQKLYTVIDSDRNEIIEEKLKEEAETIKLCINMDCERYPPDWDLEEDTEDTYQAGQWQKCCLCDGYFDDDGSGDILYIQEAPNNKEAECNLCGKSEDIVQMKGTGQYLCGNACDEEEESEECEDEGIGCNACYACVSGGSTPCILENQTK